MGSLRCSHLDSSKPQMTSEQEQTFRGGKLPNGADVSACKACFDEFKKSSEKIKNFDWGGKVYLVRITQPSPIAKQPLDDILS